MDPTLLWVLAIVLIVIGLAGTVLPGVPGVIAVFGDAGAPAELA